MSEQSIIYLAVAVALAIIVPLAYYAGTLFYQLKHQTTRQNAVRQERVEKISQSVQTIAMAMEQQQCNLSEGAIRLVNLLESLPVKNVPECEQEYPALFELFQHVRHLPTHEARKSLSKSERQLQDKVREEHEARLESKILTEIAPLQKFAI